MFWSLMFASLWLTSSNPLIRLTVVSWIIFLAGWGCLGGFDMPIFEYHARVRLRFKLSCGLSQCWTRDGGIPQGCSLSMVFIVALYLPWCRHLESFRGLNRNYTRITSSVFIVMMMTCWRLLGLLIPIFGWLDRPLLLASAFYLAPLLWLGGS